MASSHSLDALSVQFDDANLVANAGLVLPATLAKTTKRPAGFRRIRSDPE
jgi:hypothetical protein